MASADRRRLGLRLLQRGGAARAAERADDPSEFTADIATVFVDRVRSLVYSPKRRTSQATRSEFSSRFGGEAGVGASSCRYSSLRTVSPAGDTMMRLPRRHAGIVMILCFTIALAAGCAKKAPAVPPPPPPTPPVVHAAAASAAPAASAAAAGRLRACRPRTRSGPARRVDQLNKEGVLADVFFDLDMYGVREDAPRAAAAQRRLPEAVAVTAHHRGRPLRRARHRGVQPQPRRAALDRGQGLSREPGRPGRPHHGHQQGQGDALLHREQREPAGSRTAAATSSSPAK